MRNFPLRAAFAVGQESIAAQQIFTDRVTEVSAFGLSLESLEDHLAAAEISPVTDRGMARKNVLVYYGVGGIGKTTLSHELMRGFAEPGGKRDRNRAVVRFDFNEASSFDIESYILRLRAGLSGIAREWPAFDVAFAAYWDRAHPGEPLREFIASDSVLRRIANAAGLAEVIVEAVTSVVGVAFPAVGHATSAVGNLVWRRARDAVRRHRVLGKCDLLDALLEAEADLETLSYFPYLLAWDLARMPPQTRVVVFLDTFEEVTSLRTSETERWVQRSVFLMPNVLFVITGRNRLDWADGTRGHELDYTGPRRWPNLGRGHTTEEPRQHLVGYLSAADADDYLSAALMVDDQPAIPEAVRERMVAASGGLPLYLDLVVTMFLDIIAQGGVPVPDDFGQPLPAVAARILRDLTGEERNLLRAAALLGAFDVDMLRAVCPEASDATLLRFTGRTFLEADADRYWPYSLHVLFRDAIRSADVGLQDSWSSRERDQAALRAGGHLRAVAAAAVADGDRSTQVAAITKAIDLCLGTGQLFGWLIEAIQGMLVSGGWTALSDLPEGHEHDQTALSAVLLGLQGARERRSGRLGDAIVLMGHALSVPDLPAQLRRFLTLHRGHALRVAGRYDQAAEDYRRLIDEADGFHDDAAYWLADYTFLQGRFNEALAALDDLSGESPELRGEILRLRGHVYRVNALFDQAEARYREALDLARDTSNKAAEGKALTDLMQTLAWHRPADAMGLRDQALQVNEDLRNRVEIVKIRAASSVALTQLAELAAADEEIERGLALTEECGYPGGQVWCWVARVLHKIRDSDDEGAAAAASRVTAISHELRGNRFWSEVAHWWTGASGDEPASTAWLGGDGQARERWLSVRDDTGYPAEGN